MMKTVMQTGRTAPRARRRDGLLTMELAIAMAILATVLLPLAFSFLREQKLCRAYYVRSVAMEIVDGEMEVLVAGEWKAFAPGEHDYEVTAPALKSLPPGRFRLFIEPAEMRLEWQPAKRGYGGTVIRKVRFVRAGIEDAREPQDRTIGSSARPGAGANEEVE